MHFLIDCFRITEKIRLLGTSVAAFFISLFWLVHFSWSFFLFPANFNQTHQKKLVFWNQSIFLSELTRFTPNYEFSGNRKNFKWWLSLGGAIDSSVFSPITGFELILPKLQKWGNLEKNSNGHSKSENFTSVPKGLGSNPAQDLVSQWNYFRHFNLIPSTQNCTNVWFAWVAIL